MMLISTAAGGLLLYMIFERFLKKSFLQAQRHRKTVELSALIIAATAMIITVSSLIYMLDTIDDLQDRNKMLEKAMQSPPRASP